MKKNKIAYWIMCLLLCTMLFGCSSTKKQDEKQDEQITDYKMLMDTWNEQVTSSELTCWYTSDTDADWLKSMAKQFEKEFAVKVNLVHYDGTDLIEDMNQLNQKGNGPDVFLSGNDQLQLIVESGMAWEQQIPTDKFWSDYYPDVAKSAVTYHDKQYGYPIYFDTYCLVYDANLLETAPASIDDILLFADAYEDTGSTKAIFRWDVADPYINSMFIASYANLFGKNGDTNEFLVNDDRCVASMEYFQSLSAYLWMNKNNISHEIIIERIKNGTLVLGLCKSDILPTLYEMQALKENNQEVATQENTESSEVSQSVQEQDVTNYRVSYVPALTQEMSTTAFSTTYSAFVNPYGKDLYLGNMFSLFLSLSNPENQFAANGKLPVVNQKDKFDEMQKVIYAQYMNSKPVPKVVVFGDYLAESGIVFDRIWSGENAKEQLDALQKIMKEKMD